MLSYLSNFLKQSVTPQSEPISASQTRNAAGGYVWALDEWKRLERFLILGSEGGTYYTSERTLTAENARSVEAAIRLDGVAVVRMVIDISAAARAPKNDPALFVLAMAASPQFADAKTNAAALAGLPLVARTGTHLCQFAGFVDQLRGWGRSLRSAVALWYEEKPLHELAYQMVKYRDRAGWTHRDLLRKSHPKARSEGHDALFRWAVTGVLREDTPSDVMLSDLRLVHAFELAKKATTEVEIVRLIQDDRLTHEMIPDKWKSSAAVWEALLEAMPFTAMVRSLAKMTAVGLLAPMSDASRLVAERLTDRRRVAKSKVHPVALLSALMTYKQGRGVRGGLRWTPSAEVFDALDEAFYLAFDNVEPTGKRVYLALDASGSMQGSMCAGGLPHVTAAMGSAAMAMSLARSEPAHMLAAFHDEVWPVDITRKDRLDRACEAIVRAPRATDASLPMLDALARGIEVDAFVLMTDNETWAGKQHPVQALAEYRKASGMATKLIVVAMAANAYSIVDPNDAGQLDVAGFDANVPRVIGDFVAG